jgi:hypothetical protein
MRSVFNTTVLAIALLFCTQSFGQKKTFPGFYVSTAGDTVTGTFINYSDWDKNPSDVDFAATSGKTTKLTPQNCRTFVVEGQDEYLSYVGKRLVNPIDDHEVLSRHHTNFGDEEEEVVTFLRLVARAPECELYVFTGSKRSNFFYRVPGSSAVELKFKKYYYLNYLVDVYEYQVGSIISSEDYKVQLNNVFAEAIYRRKLASSLKTLLYTETNVKRKMRRRVGSFLWEFQRILLR